MEKNIGPISSNHVASTVVTHCMYSLVVNTNYRPQNANANTNANTNANANANRSLLVTCLLHR
jgi:hypothetical protein